MQQIAIFLRFSNIYCKYTTIYNGAGVSPVSKKYRMPYDIVLALNLLEISSFFNILAS